MSEVKNIFKQEKIMLQLTFNPGLTLTGFRTTQPWCLVDHNDPDGLDGKILGFYEIS